MQTILNTHEKALIEQLIEDIDITMFETRQENIECENVIKDNENQISVYEMQLELLKGML